MLLTSNQSARTYATAKTCKISHAGSININGLKFKPITDRAGIMILNASKVISNYLKLFCKNSYNIQEAISFGDILRFYRPLNWFETFSFISLSHFSLPYH